MTETTIPSLALSGGQDLVAAVTAFLYAESAALDDQRYEDWIAILSDDYEYRVPVPTSQEDPALSRYSDIAVLAWESKSSLRYRFDRYKSEFAWADRPAAFIRRFVTNVRVEASDRPDEYVVKSCLLAVRSRMPEPTVVLSAGRIDLVRGNVDQELLLARRTAHLDTEVPSAAQLAILL